MKSLPYLISYLHKIYRIFIPFLSFFPALEIDFRSILIWKTCRVGPTRQPALLIALGPMCQNSSPTRRPCHAQHATPQLSSATLSLPPSAVRSSSALHSVLLHVASFRQYQSPCISLKPLPARAILSSSPRRHPPQAAHGAALPRVAVSVSRSPESSDAAPSELQHPSHAASSSKPHHPRPQSKQATTTLSSAAEAQAVVFSHR
jgi:hypothetical protein